MARNRQRVKSREASEASPDVAEATVESLTHDARGVAHIDGKAVFIEGALPGERVRFRYHQKRSRFDTGGVVEVLVPSPDRTTPPCPHFGVCGGCSLQHMSPAAQLRAKQQVLADTLKHVGRVAPERWLDPVAGLDGGYRRRARLGARWVFKKNSVLVGFRERKSSYIAELNTCYVLDARAARLITPLRSLIATLSRPDRIPQVEVAGADNYMALLVRHLEPLTEDDQTRLRDFAVTHGVVMYVQPSTPDTIQALAPTEPPVLTYELPEFDLSLAFAPVDFIQVNGAVNRALIGRAIGLLDVTAEDRVLDLFCGLGNFTLPLARRANTVVGIEGEAGLVERARENARRNGISNAEFRVGNLYDTSKPFEWASEGFGKVLLDPPRAGAIDAIKALSQHPPKRIVYVSCYPATLARDSEYLVHVLGYRLAAAGVADMFPHTDHVESLALYVKD